MIQIILGAIAGIAVDGVITYGVARSIKSSQTDLVDKALNELEAAIMAEMPKIMALMQQGEK